MPSEAVELVFRFKSQNPQELANIKAGLAGITAQAAAGSASLVQLTQNSAKMGQSFTASLLKADLLAAGFIRLAGSIRNVVEESARYAARTDQLAIISDSLARVNGLNVQGVRNQADEVKRLGITTQASLELTTRLIQARVDLSKAPQLARVAQDAAKIAGINSSEALEKIVMSIGTGMVRPLHQMGLMVNFGTANADYAANLHKNVQALTQQEMAEARLQAVIKAGAGIYGTYEASQLTAAGQMQSLARYTDELKNKFGEGLQPVLFSIIGTMRSLTTVAGENVDEFQHLTAGAAALAAGGTAFAATSFLPAPWRLGVSALFAGGAYLATDQDPAKSQIEVSRDALQQFELRQKAFANDPTVTEGAEQARQRIVDETRFRLALIYKQREARGEKVADLSALSPSDIAAAGRIGMSPAEYAKAKGIGVSSSAYPDKIDLGFGQIITGEQLKHEFDTKPGGTLKPEPLDDDEATKAFADLTKERAKSLRSQLNSAQIQMLSGAAKIDAQTKFMRDELASSLLGFSPKQLASPEVGQLYGYISKIGAAERTKYERERQIKALEYNSDFELKSRGIDTKKKQPGDLSDANAEYNSSLNLAYSKLEVDHNQDAYQDAINAANLKLQKARRAAEQAQDDAEADEQVTGIKTKSSLSLRMLGVGKTNQNAGQTIAQEYQIRVQAAADEYSITGDLKQLRADISTAWADKMVATAEHEKQALERQKQDRIELIQSEGEFRSRIGALDGEPGDQFTAIRDAYRERLSIALQIFQVDQKADDLKKRTLAAEHDMEISIAEIRKKGLEEYEQMAGKVFDALLARGDRGNAMRNLFLGQAETLGRKVFTNLAGLTFDTVQKLGVGDMIPGQYEKNPDGSPKIDPKTGNPILTTIGKALAGTPLGTNQAKLAHAGIQPGVHATEVNTTATQDNTNAIRDLTAAIERIIGAKPGSLSATLHSMSGGTFSPSVLLGGFGGSAAALPASVASNPTFSSTSRIIFGDGTSDSAGGSYGSTGAGGSYSPYDEGDIPGIGEGSSGVDSAGSSSGAGISDEPGGYANLPPGPGVNPATIPGPVSAGGSAAKSSGSLAGPLFDSTASTSARAMSGIASAGALYAGTMGVIGGIKKGGAQGAINAIGSAAGTAAAFDPEPISKTILAGVALVSGVISGIIGDPKQRFATDQANDLRNNHWFGPQQLNVTSDGGGNLVQQGFRGGVTATGYDAFALQNNPSHYQSYNGVWDVVPGSVTQQYKSGPSGPPVVVQVSAMDASGLQERSNDIADAVHTAMMRGHPLNATVAQSSK